MSLKCLCMRSTLSPTGTQVQALTPTAPLQPPPPPPPPGGQNVREVPTIVQAKLEKLAGATGAEKFWCPI